MHIVVACYILSAVILEVFISSLSADMNITFTLSTQTKYDVFEGDTVNMKCQQEKNGLIFISYNDKVIVENSVLVSLQQRYSFYYVELSTTFILTVQGIEREDSGQYFCAEGESLVKQFYLNVLYSPSLPNCTSSYGAASTFFDDEFQENFQFMCTIEDGNPPIHIIVFNEGEEGVKIAPTEASEMRINDRHLQRTLTFSSYLNSSYNNSRFICNASQALPLALKEHVFVETCSYGPMVLLPSFDISVAPFNISVRKGDVARVTCSSNVSDVEKRWHRIEEDIVYSIEEDENNEINLTVSDLKKIEEITVVCELSYGHRRLSAKATLFKDQNESSESRSFSFAVIFTVLLSVLFVLALLSLCVFKYCKRKHQKYDKSNKQIKTNKLSEISSNEAVKPDTS